MKTRSPSTWTSKIPPTPVTTSTALRLSSHSSRIRAARPAALGSAPQGTQYSMRMWWRSAIALILSKVPSHERLVDDARRGHSTSPKSHPTSRSSRVDENSSDPFTRPVGTGRVSFDRDEHRLRHRPASRRCRPQTRNAGPAQPIHPRPWEGVLGRTPRPTRHALVSSSACGILSDPPFRADGVAPHVEDDEAKSDACPKPSIGRRRSRHRRPRDRRSPGGRETPHTAVPAHARHRR